MEPQYNSKSTGKFLMYFIKYNFYILINYKLYILKYFSNYVKNILTILNRFNWSKF